MPNRLFFASALLVSSIMAGSSYAQSENSKPQGEIYISCKHDEGAFVAVISGNSGPISIYDNKELWHRFPNHVETDVSISSTQIVRNAGFEKQYRAIELDRLTGSGKIVDWTDKIEIKRGKIKNEREVARKTVGECEKIESPTLERKF